MTTYGLSGPSGTGKSYNAIELCARMDIPALIDDGLFIFENNVVAGISAKRNETMIGATKTAIFSDPAHAQEVRNAILLANPSSILILGTSDRMVDQIAKTLQLPPIEEHIHIEDISSPKKMELARKLRTKEGMHTIPAPTMELKKQFSGYLLDARRSVKFTKDNESLKEKTIVRPTFSYLGKYEISAKVITDIAEKIILDTPGAAQLLWSASSNTDAGMIIRVVILCDFTAKLKDCTRAIQGQIAEAVRHMTAFNVLRVDVEVRGFK